MTDMNRFLAEKLGVCWHEYEEYYDPRISENYKCIKCGKTVLITHPYLHDPNPDFTTDEGAVQLLRLMMQREDWSGFVQSLFPNEIIHTDQVACMVEDYILTPGLLAKAALEWLRKETK